MAINTPSMAKYNGLMSVRRSDKILSKYMFRENKMSGRKTIRKKNHEPEKTEHLSVSMLNGAEFGLGTVIGSTTHLTEEDIKLADEMEREIIRKQHAVIDWSYEK